MALKQVNPQPLGVATDLDVAVARAYASEIRQACKGLSESPFSGPARAEVLRLIVADTAEADAAWTRLLVDNDAVI